MGAKNPGTSRSHWRQDLLNACVGSGLVALIWSIWEALQIHEGDMSALRTLSATAGYTLLPAIECAFVAWALSVIWRSQRLGRPVRSFASTHIELGVAAFVGLLLTSLIVHEAVLRLNDFSDSIGVRALGVGLLIPFVAAVATVTILILGRTLARAVPNGFPIDRPWFTILVLFSCTLMWFFRLRSEASEVFEALDLQWIAGILTIWSGSVLAMVILNQTPRYRRWATLPLIPVIALSAYHLSTRMPRDIGVAMDRAPNKLASVVRARLNPKSDITRAVPMPIAGGAKCFPDAPSIDLTSVGTIKRNAPDIIFISVDAFRWDRTNLSKYKRKTTPRLKKTARSAAIFTNAYTPAGSTRQSMGAIFTGLLPSQIPFKKTGPKWGLRLQKDQITLASLLRSGGYKTIAVVSDRKAFAQRHGALIGFEVVDKEPIRFFKKHKYSASIQVNKIIAHLANLPKKGAPRFVWTHLREPHHPYRSGPAKKRFGKGNSNRYDSSLYYIDYELNRILEFARSAERKKRTVVVVTSDHGEGFNEHGMKYHGSGMYEELVRVPLIFWGPGIKARRHIRPTSVLDVSKTILSLATLSPPEAWCGRDLAPYLKKGRPAPEAPVYSEVIPDKTRPFFVTLYRTGDKKLIWDVEAGNAELYDLSEDPGEKNDLAAERPELVQRIIKEMMRFQKKRGLNPVDYRLLESDATP